MQSPDRALRHDHADLDRAMDANLTDRRLALRETLALGLILAVAAGASVLGLWLAAVSTLRTDYQHHLTTLAIAAAELVDPELHRSLHSPAQFNRAEYLRAVQPLQRMVRAVPEARHLYTVVNDADVLRYVLDAADQDPRNGGADGQAGLWDPYLDADAAMATAFGTDAIVGQASATPEPHTDRRGSMMTGWAPLRDSAGMQYGVLGIDVDAAPYLTQLDLARTRALLGLLPALLMIGVLTIGFYRIRRRELAATRSRIHTARVLTGEQQRLSSIIEGTNVGTWESRTDLHGNVQIIVDARWAAMLGRHAAEMNPLTPRNFFPLLVHPEDAPTMRAGIIRAQDEKGRLIEMDVRMRHAAGHWVWTEVRGKVVERHPDGRLRRMVGTQVDISERKAMESELAAAARRDKLTGLANRTLFLEALQGSVERVQSGRQRRFAVLFLDFDRFKLVNDALGHEAGDSLLREIAARLVSSLREVDARLAADDASLVARFGGDEFLVLINEPEDDTAVERIANQLLESLSRIYSVHGRDIYSTASIGIVTNAQCVESAEAVVRNADVAMYEAKHLGRACAVMFDEAMRARLTRYMTIDSGLRKALGTAEFSLVYQPIFELDSGDMVCVEALARWQHPTLGAVMPAEFIPVAEESGLIISLGQWALQQACSTLAAWRAHAPDTAPRTISVNISRAELSLGERLLKRVCAALHEAGLPPQCLQLEVTESDVMRDPEASLKLMHALRAMGVRLAMDDFGTGTSSLACLRDYPFDVIKIDRGFISDLTGSSDVLAVIHAAITLIQNLGKHSVAEGVETAEQVAMLQSLGCHFAQGYHFSRPLSAQQVLESITQHREARRA